MKFGQWIIASVALLLVACSGPKDTPLPKDLSKMESIKPAVEKLTDKERELLAGYMMRQALGKMGGVFGGKGGEGVPDGMTIGKAIEEQKKFIEERAAEEAKQKALAEKLKAEREVAMKAMRDVVTVTLVSKKLREERGMSGMTLDEHLEVTFGYKNNGAKDIAGVKGRIVVQDLFGDAVSTFGVSNDTTIPAGASTTWTGSRSVKFSLGSNKDRKLAELSDDKFKIVWEPQVIVFSDGSKMAASE